MFIFDAHVDTLWRLLESGARLDDAQGHVNLANLRGPGAQFFAAFVDPKYYHGLAMHRTMEMIDLFWHLVDTYPEVLSFAGSAAEIKQVSSQGRLACLLAIEGGEALEGSLAALGVYYRLGVRLITLTWNHRNALAAGQWEGPEGGGLSKFGRDVVEEMNRLGMLVDVSHLNEPSFWDVLAVSRDPVLASHSNAKALCDHPRNLTDEQIRAVADRGGVIGVNFCPAFLRTDCRATVEHVVEQIAYLINVGGEDCAALGSDFDGITEVPTGMEHYGRLRDLVGLLEQQGLRTSVIEKVLGTNLLRLCSEVLD
ncbi:MAG: membrane dipeptidase [Firmicutes bacterium]|nr:membrane dipeptidase [Bacillota bacterium]